jgi:hypothetical protein
VLKHIELSEFSTRAGDDSYFTSNWGGWTRLGRDPEQDYHNMLSTFSGKDVHEDDFLLFRAFDGEPGLFVDIGANMGFSAISLRNVNKTFNILSFEVVPFVAPVLELVAKDLEYFQPDRIAQVRRAARG